MSLAATSVLGDCVRFLGSYSVGHASYIGYPSQKQVAETVIGDRARIGAFCLLESGCQLGDDTEIDDYVRIAGDVVIGQRTKILEKVHIHGKARIGKECIIGGDIAERTIVEDRVTFMGEIAHSHRHPTDIDSWDVTDEPSPTIRCGCIIGVGAIIIGSVEIGPQSYIGAGEVVRCDVPPQTVLYNGVFTPLSSWRGVIKVRD